MIPNVKSNKGKNQHDFEKENKQGGKDCALLPMSNKVRDELTINISDNEDAPDSPILLFTNFKIYIKCY